MSQVLLDTAIIKCLGDCIEQITHTKSEEVKVEHNCLDLLEGISSIPNSPGVYIVLLNCGKPDEEIVYIGSSNDLKKRIRNFVKQYKRKEAKRPHKPAGYCGQSLNEPISSLKIKTIITQSEEYARAIERYLIYMHKKLTGKLPQCNKR